jgi:hypothetical protein
MKLSEALCDFIHVQQVRFRTLAEEGEDRGGPHSVARPRKKSGNTAP